MRSLLGTFAALACLVACGGSTASINDAGSDSGGGGNDAANDGGGGGGPCPSSAPNAGSACTKQVVCEYGSSANRACNVVATCNGATWSLSTPAPSCGGKNPPKCPATYASVPKGASCSDAYPTDCTYPEGICSCTPGAGGPVPLDASAAATWHCDVPSDSKCPSPRPKIGSACATPNQLCDYGACIFPDGTAMKCESGYWNQADVPCPL